MKDTRVIPLCIGAAIAVVMLLCSVSTRKGESAKAAATEMQDLQVVLLARTASLKAGGQVILWLAVHNPGKKAVLIDGRMGWPGNVFLWVRLPGSPEESGAETFRPRISRPSKTDLVRIPSDCFYGLEMVVGKHNDEYLVKELRNLRPGTYTFRVVYYSPDVPQLGAHGFEESSNSVVVTVK